MADLPASLAALLGLARGPSERVERGGTITLLTLPGRGLVGAAVTPSGSEPGFPLPLGLLQSLGGQVSRVPVAAVAEEDAAADALGGIMRMMMEQMAQIAMQRSMEESGPKVPPASERVRDALPRVVVTKEDLLDATNSKCSVCLEDYRPGVRATRMLCGHLFCTACIREWLREANSCPVCRYELATDCEDFENGRKTRMSGRTVRLRAAELRMLRISELRRLMDALGVSGAGCLERADLVRHLEATPDVEVAPEVPAAMAEKQHCYDLRDLEKLELPLLRNLMERHRVPFDLEEELSEEDERRVALRSFADSGWMRNTSKTTNAESELPGSLKVSQAKDETTECRHCEQAAQLDEAKEEVDAEDRKERSSERAREGSSRAPSVASMASRANTQPGTQPGEAEPASEEGPAAKSRGKAARPAEPPPVRRRPRPGQDANEAKKAKSEKTAQAEEETKAENSASTEPSSSSSASPAVAPSGESF